MFIENIQKLSVDFPVNYFPYAGESVKAGWPSPADDYRDGSIDLNKHLISHPASTFLVRARGESMTEAGISDGDELIVDKSMMARSGDIVIAVVEGEFTVKRLQMGVESIRLEAAHPEYAPILLNDKEWTIWGVVTRILHNPRV